MHENEDGNSSRKVPRGNPILVQSGKVATPWSFSPLHSERQKTEGGKEGEGGSVRTHGESSDGWTAPDDAIS